MRNPLSQRDVAQASVEEAINWWDRNPSTIRRPDGSALHKLMEAWVAGVVVSPNSASTAAGREFMASMIMGRPQVFLVQHDWTAALRHDIDLGTVEPRLPFELVAYEFDISGHRVIHIEHQERGSMVAVHAGQHWCAFPLWTAYTPPKTREVGLNSIFQITTEMVRAITILLESDVLLAQHIEAAPALNRSRARSKKPPIFDHHVLNIAISRPTSALDAEPGMAGGKPGVRLHFRRGHYRRVEGGSTWIRWTLVGDPDLGFVEKTYRL
ncbi:hypothetical protein [Devosia elaeis]|nr:hypothetical protein [Devosia elaeis]